ncbi:MAG: Gfo/Idh/MocA family oxidoreductase [Deltaproteobacteria bacterium]|nr:Gfo/Idh/MocA family oxidoreductase [Deltaproteobacteria bacterium]
MGYGSIGKRHAKNFLDFADVAVFDENLSLLNSLNPQIRSFDNLDTALEWKPDGVVIATPHHTHIPLAEKAIHSNAYVLIEKPISHSFEGVRILLSEAEQRKRQVFVACNMRYHPGIATLQQYLHTIGKPLFARAHVGNYLANMRPDKDYRSLYCAHRTQGGGVILDAIHEIDYLMWFFGPIREVSCRAEKLSDMDIDVEDFACLYLKHRNMIISEIQMDYLRPFKRRGCEIVGTKGTLLWQSEGKNPEACIVKLYTKKINTLETLFKDTNMDGNKPYVCLAQQFIAAIKNAHSSLLTGETALSELHIALAAHKSASTKNGAFVSM